MERARPRVLGESESLECREILQQRSQSRRLGSSDVVSLDGKHGATCEKSEENLAAALLQGQAPQHQKQRGVS